MNRRCFRFDVRYSSPGSFSDGMLVRDRHFRFDETGIAAFLMQALQSRVLDLLRIAMAVYVADRRARRAVANVNRDIALTVEVEDIEFWQRDSVVDLLRQTIEFLSNDQWGFSFGRLYPHQRTCQALVAQPPVDLMNPLVCLYSGGLDSAAGLVRVIRESRRPVLAVTIRHQAGLGDIVRRQLESVERKYKVRIQRLILNAFLKRSTPAMEDPLQRCRAFLFGSIAAAAAIGTASNEVFVMENGVGAINAPAMTGMLVGARSTRGCHPRFLALLSKLITQVSGRRIEFRLPFVRMTKADLVRVLVSERLEGLAQSTASCVHYPLRRADRAKQCGSCAACVERRQAMLAAGLPEDVGQYQWDFPEPYSLDHSRRQWDHLKVILLQVHDLGALRNEVWPYALDRHTGATELFACGVLRDECTRLHQRYCDEWLSIIELARHRGCEWVEWISSADAA